MNGRITELRRELHREANELLQKEILKGTRWLLMNFRETCGMTETSRFASKRP